MWNVELYLTTFKNVATAERWPHGHWCTILQLLLTGKAQKISGNLTLNKICVHDHVCLQENEQLPIPKPIMNNFVAALNCLKITLLILLYIWLQILNLRCVNAENDIKKLKQIILPKQFYE